MRCIFEALGADVSWNSENQTILAKKGDISVSLTIGSKVAFKNNQEIALDVPPFITDGRTMVPVRFVSECLGYSVKWEAEKNTVNITTAADIVLAASDTPEDLKKSATHICSGANDQVQIQAAVAAAAGGKCLILPGTYNKDSSAGVAVQSNTEIEISRGAIINQNKLDADCSIFKNTDQVNGNTNIKIHGEGVLNGNRQKSTAGNQYAVDFVKVKGGLVECYIDNFRTLEARLRESDAVVRNLRFYNMPKDEYVLIEFLSADSSGFTTINQANTTWSIETANPCHDASYIKIAVNKGQQGGVEFDKLSDTEQSLDLRYKMFSFWMRIEGLTSDKDLSTVLDAVKLGFHGEKGYPAQDFMLTAMYSRNSTVWVRLIGVPSANNESMLARTMSRVKYISLRVDAAQTGELPGPLTVDFDDLSLIPIKDGGKVCFSFDDGYSTWGKIGDILTEYGYKGCFNIVTGGYNNGEHKTYSDLLPVYKKLALAGHEIGSHSHSHSVDRQSLFSELIKSKEILQRDGLGDIRFFAYPGGSSLWLGDMVAAAHEVYSGCRATAKNITTQGEIKPLFSTVAITLDNSMEKIKAQIAWAVNNHENVALYAHTLDGVDCSEVRLREVCDFLHDMGIPVVTYSEMFPENMYPEPDWRAAEKKYLQGE
ncbi:MAG: polysaccharide deacetylase family protein [Peptococcaceae bacterium]|nr:polysaccharide deacetylase family protein [Peptococcaceae bacterium]